MTESIKSVTSAENGVTAHEVIALLNFTNYTDMLKEIGMNSNTIMVPHVSGTSGGLDDIISKSIIQAGQINASALPSNKVTADVASSDGKAVDISEETNESIASANDFHHSERETEMNRIWEHLGVSSDIGSFND